MQALAQGPFEHWCYDVIMLIQPWCDVFDENVMQNGLYEYQKRLICVSMITQQFLLFGGAWA